VAYKEDIVCTDVALEFLSARLGTSRQPVSAPQAAGKIGNES
jgi:hypothetical protein